ncbi:hypothetical protein [Klebsiella pneumoniae]|uniref:hypothetical protein n=1 Tax=Klebsiella pneumoniae TaxID=573 RepID=UPI00272F2D15|nr:hypothetical protein [Klebsiella pneumoniae]MDP0667306.1 hypothetical protein [Klebsiella pneumoniae]MDP0810705.1 hypothetical protein [Klebsiella pneumoniae]
MKKILLGAVILPLLYGCVADMSRDGDLSLLNGVSYKNKGQYEYLKQYSKTTNIQNPSIDKIKICVLRNITNRDVMLNDSSRSFVGAYTGNYYNINSSSKSNGGDVVSLSGNNAIVVNGSTDYLFNSGVISVKRVVRFTLDIVTANNKVSYTFSNIQQAQTETGSIPNNGFNDIGTWKGASPAQAIKSMEEITHDLESCLNS